MVIYDTVNLEKNDMSVSEAAQDQEPLTTYDSETNITNFTIDMTKPTAPINSITTTTEINPTTIV